MTQDITLLDVAKRAGVSRSTASAVLGGRADAVKIAQSTRKRVQRAATALKYRVNPHARRLRAHHTKIVGVLVAHLGDVWYGMLLNELDAALSAAGLSMLLATGENRPGRYDACLAMLANHAADGVIFMGGALPVKKLLAKAPDIRAIWVQGAAAFRDAAVVGLDPDHTMGLLVDHLVGLGHKQFGYLGFPTRQVDASDRLKSARRALAEHALGIGASAVERARSLAGLGSAQNACVAAAKLLDRCPDITALLCFDDNTALGAARAVTERGLTVGRDVSITGIDDNPYAAMAMPALTTVRYPLRDVARACVDTIVKLIGDDTAGGHDPLWLRGKLVQRDSTGPCVRPSQET